MKGDTSCYVFVLIVVVFGLLAILFTLLRYFSSSHSSSRSSSHSSSRSEPKKEKKKQTATVDLPIVLVITNFHERIRGTLLAGARNVGYEVVVCPRPENLHLTPEQQHRVIAVLLGLTFVSDGQERTQQGFFRGWDYYQEAILDKKNKNIPFFILHSRVLLDDVSKLKEHLRPCDKFMVEGMPNVEWFVNHLLQICKPPDTFGKITYIE